MLGVFAAHFLQPVVILFPYPTNYLALVPIVIGATLNILSDRELRLNNAINDKGCSQSKVLVSSGVYRYSRNPAYLGLLLIVIGLAIWVGSLSPWLVVVGFIWFLSRVYIQKEEAALVAQFGSEYDAYMQKTPRWCSAFQIKR